MQRGPEVDSRSHPDPLGPAEVFLDDSALRHVVNDGSPTFEGR